KAIKKPYQMVTINYFSTSVQRLYKIGTDGEWQNYKDTPIWLNQGETIYAKGIDQYGNETRRISNYTANSSDALPSEVYDGNDNTYLSTSSIKYMLVDNSMQGKTIRLVSKASCIVYALKCTNDTGATVTIQFLDENKNLISKIVKTKNFVIITDMVTIPIGTKYITYTGISYYSNYTDWLPYLYEITPQ
ncbi:MAG: hypothetical protein ACK5HP_03660, partial [Bacilli bacterium]